MELSTIFNYAANAVLAYGATLLASYPASLIYNNWLTNEKIRSGWRPDMLGFSVTPPNRTDVYVNFFGKPHFAADRAGVHMHSLGIPFLPLLWTKRMVSFNPLLKIHNDQLDNLKTAEGNIVTIPLVVQYRIRNALKFAFSAESLKVAGKAVTDRVKKHVQVKVGSMTTDELFEFTRSNGGNSINILDPDDLRLADDLYQFGVEVDSVFVFEPQLEQIQQDAHAIKASMVMMQRIYNETYETVYRAAISSQGENPDLERAHSMAAKQAEEAKRSAQQIFFAERLGGKGLVNLDMADISGRGREERIGNRKAESPPAPEKQSPPPADEFEPI